MSDDMATYEGIYGISIKIKQSFIYLITLMAHMKLH